MEAFFCISLIVDVSLFVLRSACCVFMTLSLFFSYFDIKEWMILLTTSACCVFDWCGLFRLFIWVKRLLVHVLFISTVLESMLRLVS